MVTWIMENIGTILISMILILIVLAIVMHMIRERKRGKSSCGCACSHCAMNGSCHAREFPDG